MEVLEDQKENINGQPTKPRLMSRHLRFINRFFLVESSVENMKIIQTIKRIPITFFMYSLVLITDNILLRKRYHLFLSFAKTI